MRVATELCHEGEDLMVEGEALLAQFNKVPELETLVLVKGEELGLVLLVVLLDNGPVFS